MRATVSVKIGSCYLWWSVESRQNKYESHAKTLSWFFYTPSVPALKMVHANIIGRGPVHANHASKNKRARGRSSPNPPYSADWRSVDLVPNIHRVIMIMIY